MVSTASWARLSVAVAPPAASLGGRGVHHQHVDGRPGVGQRIRGRRERRGVLCRVPNRRPVAVFPRECALVDLHDLLGRGVRAADREVLAAREDVPLHLTVAGHEDHRAPGIVGDLAEPGEMLVAAALKPALDRLEFLVFEEVQTDRIRPVGEIGPGHRRNVDLHPASPDLGAPAAADGRGRTRSGHDGPSRFFGEKRARLRRRAPRQRGKGKKRDHPHGKTAYTTTLLIVCPAIRLSFSPVRLDNISSAKFLSRKPDRPPRIREV